jgi:hypothetical protein
MPLLQRAVVAGVFTEPHKARQAISDLKSLGFRDDQIGMVGRYASAPAIDEPGTGSIVEEGASVGAATGAGVGALWALGIAAGMLPAIGPVVVGGLLASVLASAAGGAAILGVAGALVGLGLTEKEAHYYEGELQPGHTLLVVQADSRFEEVRTLFLRHGAYDMRTTRNKGLGF